MGKKKSRESGELPESQSVEEPITPEFDGWDMGLFFVFAYWNFKELDLDGRYTVSRAYNRFYRHATWLALGNMAWLLFDYVCLVWGLIYCFGSGDQVLSEEPWIRWFQIHAMGIHQPWEGVVWSFAKAYGRAILAVTAMMELGDHLLPAALKLQKKSLD